MYRGTLNEGHRRAGKMGIRFSAEITPPMKGTLPGDNRPPTIHFLYLSVFVMARSAYPVLSAIVSHVEPYHIV